MLKRSEYLEKIQTLIDDEKYGKIIDAIDDMLTDIEDKTKDVIDELDTIKSIDDLNNIVDANDILHEMANKLF